jgi:predicted TIM-barrel fold metal-dependent hydrolase
MFQHLKTMLGINDDPGKTLDEQYEQVLVDQIKESSLAKAAILAQDAVYDAAGNPDWSSTSFYIPNIYLFEVARRHRDLMVACPSINPNRRDAIDELNRCRESGAPMLKIHPPTQNVDPLDPKHGPFFRRCQELGMIVMVLWRPLENAFPILHPEPLSPTPNRCTCKSSVLFSSWLSAFERAGGKAVESSAAIVARLDIRREDLPFISS